MSSARHNIVLAAPLAALVLPVGPPHAAGTVTLTLAGGTLSIVGDDASNAPTITGIAVDGEPVVRAPSSTAPPPCRSSPGTDRTT